MRIVGGYLRGRKILNPVDKSTRPLKDLVRESIFNILEHSQKQFVNLDNAYVLDLFSGTGSFGIECLSRGAKKVFFFENYKPSVKILIKNLEKLEFKNKTIIFKENAFNLNKANKFLPNNFNLIFLDPPFKEKKINILLNSILDLGILNKKGLLILHRNRKNNEKYSNKFKILREECYGLSKITFGKFI